MRRVIIMNNMSRKNAIVSVDTPLIEIFENQGLMVGSAQIAVDGCFLAPGDINRTLADLGYEPDSDRDIFITATVKTQNA